MIYDKNPAKDAKGNPKKTPRIKNMSQFTLITSELRVILLIITLTIL